MKLFPAARHILTSRFATRLGTSAATILFGILLTACTREAKVAHKLDAATQAYQSGDYASAEIELKNVLDLDPGNPGALKTLGLIWVKQGALLEGGRILMAARQVRPHDDEVAVGLARAMTALGFLGEARQSLVEVLERTPADGEALMLLADSSHSEETIIDTAKRLAPLEQSGLPEATLASALLQLRLGRIDQGKNLVEDVLAENPSDPRALALMGRILQGQGRASIAVDYFKQASEAAGPREPEPIYYAGVLMALDREAEAIEVLEKITAATPDYLPAWRTLASIDAGKGRVDEAAAKLDKVLAKAPLDIDAVLLRAQIQLEQGKAEEAIPPLEALTGQFPGRPLLELTMARAYLLGGQMPKAANGLDKLLAAYPAIPDAMGLRAEIHLKQGEPAEAVGLLEGLLKLAPENTEAQKMLASAYEGADRPQNALAFARQRVEREPANAALQLDIGRLEARLGNLPEARAAFGKALELDPDNFSPVAQLAALDLLESKPDDAHRRIDAFLASHPDSAEAHVVKAALLLREDKQDEAIALLEKAIELDVVNVQAYGMLVQAQIARGNPEEAVARTKQLLENSPDELGGWMQLGGLQLELGRPAEAMAAFEAILERDPEFVPALNNIAMLEAEKGDDLDRARELARKAFKLAPNTPAVADTLGWIEWKGGKYPGALALLRQAVSGLAEDPSFLYRLGMAEYMMGQPKAASATFTRALGLGREFPEKAETEGYLAWLAASPDLAQLRQRVSEKPADVVAWIQLGDQLAGQGDDPGALDSYRKALDLNPELDAALVGIAHIQIREGNTAEALETATRARELAPSNAAATAVLGAAQLASGNPAWAYDLLRQAALADPADAKVQRQLAEAAYATGRVGEAREAMTRAEATANTPSGQQFLALTAPDAAADPALQAKAKEVLAADPDNLAARFLLARAEAPEAAAAAHRTILEAAPDFDPAKLGLARLLLDGGGKEEEAAELLKQARERSASEPDFLSLQARLSYLKDDFSYAAQLLTQLAGVRPLDPRELFVLGMSEHRLGKADEARGHLTEALKGPLGEEEQAAAREVLEGGGEE